MKTTSLNILNLCVPCYNHCKYCLLSWDGKCLGIDYERSMTYARNFYDWLKIVHKEINFTYYFGYSMDHPDLHEAIRFMQETNSPGGEFLQMDGMRIFVFTPHSGGRGISLLDSKITVNDYEKLSSNVKRYFNRNKNKTPMEWINSHELPPDKRILTLSLLPTNIEHLEHQEFEDTLKELEKMDEDYYNKIPDFQKLLERYADPKDTHLYSRKDLYLLYRKRFMEEENISVLDVTDERFSGSLRY